MKLKVFIQPNAKNNQIIGYHGDAIKIKIKAPPIDNEANETLVKFLSELLNIPQKNISLLRGQTGKNKLIEISTDLSNEQILQKIGL